MNGELKKIIPEWNETEAPTSQEIPGHRFREKLRVMTLNGSEDITINCPNDDCDEKEILKDLQDALARLTENQSKTIRDRVHILLADMQNPKDRENLVSFLYTTASINDRPFTVVRCNPGANYELGDITHETFPLGMSEKEILTHVEEQARHFLWTGSPNEGELFEPSQSSPLPALHLEHFDPYKDPYDLLALDHKVNEIDWVFLCDLDGTFIEPEPHTILMDPWVNFILDHHSGDFRNGQGNLAELRGLAEYMRKWKAQRARIHETGEMPDPREFIGYQQGIRTTAYRSSLGFNGLHITQLNRYGQEFVEIALDPKVFEFVKTMIQEIPQRGIMPVLWTGAPDPILRGILKILGMTHGSGLTYKTNDQGYITGVQRNMGLSRQKALAGHRLIQKGYAVVGMIDDTIGGRGSMSCAVNGNDFKWNPTGVGLIVNADHDTRKEIEDMFPVECEQKRVRALERRDSDTENVIKTFRLLMETLFKDDENCLQRVKTMRDILRRKGLSENDIEKLLERNYSKETVAKAMKKYNLDVRHPDDVKSLLEQTTLTDEEVAKATSAITQLTRKLGWVPDIKPKRRLSPAPFRSPVDDEKK